MIIYGRNPVFETLKNRPTKIDKIFVSKSAEHSFVEKILRISKANNIPLQFVHISKLNEIAKGKNHQGIVASVLPKEYTNLDELISKAKNSATQAICILDRITDPQNFGAILRNANFFGIIGVVIPARNSSGLTASVIKVSSGASEFVEVAKVSNISYTIDKLKKERFWIVGTDTNQGEDLRKIQIPRPVAIVLGSEGSGIKRLIKEKCDFILRISKIGPLGINSLNVASASAIIFYELSRPVF
ncbi:MAG: 23S rRNA (guanosine(2251)-2'-O)-methyltransferase RlmB [Endomicrobiia bacterium]